MSVTVENLEKNMAKLTITVAAEEMAKAQQRAYNKSKNQITVPGFRKGKAPRHIVEKIYGADIFVEDAINDLLPGAYEEAVKESGLEVVSRPAIDYVQAEHDKDLIVTALVAVKPEVKLGKYKGIKLEVEEALVTEEEIEAELKKEQDKNATMKDVDNRPVQEGDTVNLDYAGSIDGTAFAGGTAEGQDLVIGSHHFIPGFEEQMVGMQLGEEKDLHLTFPEEYGAKELAGKEAVFHVKVNSISEKELPALDDEFASEVSEFETLEAYKEDIRARLQERKNEQTKQAKENAALEKAVEAAEMDIPQAMIDSQAEDMVQEFGERLKMQGMRLEQYLQYTGMNMSQIVDQYKDQAKKRIEGRLVLEAIVEKEKIEVTEEDQEEGIRKLADQYGMEVEKVKTFFDEDSLESFKKDLATQKALDLLLASAK